MSKPFATPEEYLSGLMKLGEAAYSRKPDAILREEYDAFCAGEEVSDSIFPSFGALRRTLGLEYPEAICVAVWLYLDASALQQPATGVLLELYRRLGGRYPRQVLGRIFAANGEKAALHPVAADFLLEREPRLPAGVSLCIPQEGELLHTRALFDELAALLEAYISEEAPFPMAIALCGKNGSGRGFLISQLCLRIGASLLRVDARKNPPADDVFLAAELYGSVICLDYPQEPEQIAAITARTGFVFLRGGAEQALSESADYTLFRRDMPEPDMKSREKVLREVLGDMAPAADPALENAMHQLTVGQIKQLALRLKAEGMSSGKPADKELLLRISREQGSSQVAGVVRLECPATLRDLILPPGLTRQLTELCAFVKVRDTVYKSWGFDEKISWGRGISALFYGAPGTGKTLAAAVLANETGLPLLRVDISQLISKYIGETQKNIGKIFEQAAKGSSILFFDEADAIFAKRTESADAQDKYANAETAYLLQQMELYDGVCILATNLLQNFDEAFRRRIGYMLRFPLPDAGLREKIWRGIFPPGAPAEKLDYGLLARLLELSGSSIKNCAVHGAYLAAVSHTPITMRHLLEGAQNEYQKQGKALSPQILQMLSS